MDLALHRAMLLEMAEAKYGTLTDATVAANSQSIAKLTKKYNAMATLSNYLGSSLQTISEDEPLDIMELDDKCHQLSAYLKELHNFDELQRKVLDQIRFISMERLGLALEQTVLTLLGEKCTLMSHFFANMPDVIKRADSDMLHALS